MKLNGVRLLVFACLLGASPLFANHQGDKGSLLALQGETEELWREAYYSTLSPRVKNAVSHYVAHERSLIYCAQNSVEDHHLGDKGVPPACHSLLHQVKDAFQQVEYYLHDAYEYQQVYAAYVDTRDMLYALN